MAKRVEIINKVQDTRAGIIKKKLESDFPGIDNIKLVDVYTIDGISEEEIDKSSAVLFNPVFQESVDVGKLRGVDYAIEIGFLPGVTDNVGNTARGSIEDRLDVKVSELEVYSSKLLLVSGDVSKEDALNIGNSLANSLIQSIRVKRGGEFYIDGGMEVLVPRVNIRGKPTADLVKILNASDDELTIMGKQGIINVDGSRRGPLAMDINYMKTIQEHFKNKGRNPTDVELESLAQTWSEHCKHTIFASQIDNLVDGLYKTFIKGATEKIREKKGNKDFCVSVFTDNSGIIKFDENHFIAYKVETHNTPSFLDPFGGAITGIVGVNRDPIGTGLGAKPVINVYGFCFADPLDKRPLFKGENKTQKMLSPRRIMDGVIEGVNVGGNCSGIPTPQGFMVFDERYRGKPLVFVGTVGVMPVESAGRLSHEKKAEPGDYIVMVGGRVGKDGIHGATFSSEAMDSGSPATAVQIGDPITQKKMSDALIKEARDLGLYNSITDNGAGGLSCSVAEMAKESGGFYVKLDDVPLKYPGLNPWEIWVSESQERMTLAIPKDKWHKFSDLMKRRGVEATVIGEFTDSGNCIVDYDGKTVMDIEMDFLHDGVPSKKLETKFTKQIYEEPGLSSLENLTESLHSMLERLNVASFKFISQQYDHEVQGGSVIKPLQGKGLVNGDATVTRPVLDSRKGIVLSQAINPSYGDIDTYNMAACAIDTAIRNAVAAGANLNHLALLDNFCWCSSDEPERLGQLKRAAQACYDYAVEFETPFISGKDSMFNDFKGYDENGNPIKISVPPTLLISSIGVIEDVSKAVSLDAKFEGDLIYVLGETKNELGASEYFAMAGEQQRGKKYIGNNVPGVDAAKNKKLYMGLAEAIEEELIVSAQSINRGGLGVALAKTSIGGQLGVEVSLENLPGERLTDVSALYSESQGRIVVTVNPKYKTKFESLMEGNAFAQIGTVRGDAKFIVKGREGNVVVDSDIKEMNKTYNSTFEGY
ncbi:MAG: phosphoribosylformylglycinamidine synthase subunit PurL [Candidatus Nanoarchaeia archaeon]|nr:phosphoribosylformylglycinamidine synthase subunit PurL [Candidatus Nanoarchaeia archaeon]